jgi:hypothetical protein
MTHTDMERYQRICLNALLDRLFPQPRRTEELVVCTWRRIRPERPNPIMVNWGNRRIMDAAMAYLDWFLDEAQRLIELN